MSKNIKGFMGDQIGKLGPAVGRKWRGKMVYSSYQSNVRDPRTESQMLQRARLTVLQQLGCRLLPVLRLGMKQYAAGRQWTELNCFVSLNKDAVSGSTAEGLEVSYDALMVSKGSLAEVLFGSASFANPQEVTVAVEDGGVAGYGASADDKVYVAAYCPDKGQVMLSDGTARRTSESVTLQLPSSWQGMKAHVYAFVAGEHGKVSQSFYAGSGTVA